MTVCISRERSGEGNSEVFWESCVALLRRSEEGGDEMGDGKLENREIENRKIRERDFETFLVCVI